MTLGTARSGAAFLGGDELDVQPVGSPSCLDPFYVHEGQQAQVSADGFGPGAQVTVEIASDDAGQVLGTFAADGNGSLTATITIPSGYPTLPRGALI